MNTLERIEAIEKAQQELDAKLQSILGMLGEVQSVSQQVQATEQSVIAFGKTLTATLSSLVESKTVSSEAIMDKIVAMDSKSDRDELEGMKATGRLSPAEVVADDCVVVVSQSFVSVKAPEKSRTVSEFVLIRMPLPTLSPQLRADMQGRKVGEAIPTSKTSDGEYYMLNVKEIHRINFEAEGVAPTPDGLAMAPNGPEAEPCGCPDECDGKCGASEANSCGCDCNKQ